MFRLSSALDRSTFAAQLLHGLRGQIFCDLLCVALGDGHQTALLQGQQERLLGRQHALVQFVFSFFLQGSFKLNLSDMVDDG